MRILIIRVSSIGDVIHTLPALLLIKQLIPHATIDWVVQKKAASLLVNNPLINTLHIIPDNYLYPMNWSALGKTIQTLRAVEWDAIIDFQGLIKTSVIISRLRGTKFGFSWKHARWAPSSLFTDKKTDVEYINIIQKNLSLASFVCHTLAPQASQPSLLALAKSFKVDISEENKQLVNEWINKIGSNFIAVCPNTTWESKHWPQEHWQALLKSYTGPALPVIVGTTYGPAASSLALYATQNNLHHGIMPAWDLATTAYALSKAHLVVGPDTGLMHLVDFIGGSALTLFGPTLKDRHGPFITPANKERAIQIPCNHRYKKTHGPERDCMIALTPSELLKKLQLYM